MEETVEAEGKAASREDEQPFRWRGTLFKMIESAATTFMSIMVLGFVLSSSTQDQLSDIVLQDGGIWLSSLLQISCASKSGARI